jgi:aspartate kinase
MKVFKFGGASINSIERIQAVAKILQLQQSEKLVIIISAMGKTTNALEEVVDAFFANKKDVALHLFEQIKNIHLDICKQLIIQNWSETENSLKDFFTEIEWLLHDNPVRGYDYYYDQIVCCGELLSTTMMSDYLNEIGIKNKWLDVRDIIRTDNNFRDALIDINFTQKKIDTEIAPLFNHTDIVITQGFIGATDENESTTLGREGSDYSAAIFANMVNATELIIWKDVEGVMNADPKAFADATYLPLLSYTEVIEMAYYGAQVIHPKTIKPLQNKNIELQVKSFLNPSAQGTIVSNKTVQHLPPIIVLKQNQVLIKFTVKDFSFVSEDSVSQLYNLFLQVKISPNLLQIGAINLMCCLDDKPEKIEQLALAASELFEVQLIKNLTLLTIKHYTPEKIISLTANKTILLQQQTPQTVQVVMQ